MPPLPMLGTELWSSGRAQALVTFEPFLQPQNLRVVEEMMETLLPFLHLVLCRNEPEVFKGQVGIPGCSLIKLLGQCVHLVN